MSGMATELPRRPVSLVGESVSTRAIREIAKRIAVGDAKVLITGESGVGKDVIAQYIHAHSTRSARPFVTVNCAAISETLLESELFGHVKGSFTGAYRDKTGRFQLAHRGTAFLDEIGETSLRMQGLLLRFLETGEIYPVGSETLHSTVDVRVIAATNRDLPRLVSSGQFREDLMYRVKVVHLHVPPLRDRMDDLPLLVEHLVQRSGRPIRFTDAAIKHLMSYHWPGNIRELHNVIEQASWIAAREIIDVDDVKEIVRPSSPPRSDRDRCSQVADELYDALCDGHVTFWGEVYPRFLQRDMTRDDLRELVRRGLAHVGGNYRALLPLFGITARDYKRFLNFLAAHDCALDFRGFRSARSAAPTRRDS
jgi:transcriptional regulator with PAS, ATPase and Fis domain